MTIRRTDVRLGFQFELLSDNVNFTGLSVAKFIDHLGRNLGGPITLIWDEIRIHYAEPVRDWLSRHPSVEVEQLPPYAPELNPVDYIWSYVKYGRLANYCPHNTRELRNRVTAELTRVNKLPHLLRSLFLRTGLTLDGIE